LYKVIKFFTDLHDNNHAYNVGDVFPRDGVTVAEKRIAELAGSNNRQNCPLTEFVEDAPKKPARRKKAAVEESTEE
jgi:hypothetical protein